ncbi:MAG: DUF4922 domain-containing protein [Acidobacteria bacterium]|nr:MAG: DUF4922 domain-containing protein [Acidobacteriota bacterium]
MTDLTGAVDALLRRQLADWPLLGRGVAGLASALTRPVAAGGAEVLLRHVPHRAASTTAKVDPESVGRRPCFLCPANLDPEEEGLPFGADFTVYCNPFPVVEKHLTVVHREHRPQRVEGLAGTLLDLALCLPGSFVLYNGPECGASAPDHLHLQAGSREPLPLLADAARSRGPALERHGVRALLLRGEDRARLAAGVERAVSILSDVTGRRPEPLVNLVAFHEEGAGSTVLVFPRAKHRPDAFHRGELTVSPAAIDLCGLLVVPVARDFERLTGEEVAAVLGEVTLGEEEFREVVARLEEPR